MYYRYIIYVANVSTGVDTYKTNSKTSETQVGLLFYKGRYQYATIRTSISGPTWLLLHPTISPENASFWITIMCVSVCSAFEGRLRFVDSQFIWIYRDGFIWLRFKYPISIRI